METTTKQPPNLLKEMQKKDPSLTVNDMKGWNKIFKLGTMPIDDKILIHTATIEEVKSFIKITRVMNEAREELKSSQRKGKR